MSAADADVAIIGGGLVGLATALGLRANGHRAAIVVLEKEPGLCRHQSGRNSGVVHAGIYYRPGSKKAALAVAGARQMVAFCRNEGVPLEVRGKVIVALHEAELPMLELLLARAQANGVPGVERVGPAELLDLQPHVAGLAALWVPGTAITDFSAVGARMGEILRREGVEIRTGAEVLGLRDDGQRWQIGLGEDEVRARTLINCAGLHSDRIAALAGLRSPVRIVPFRGEYLALGDPWPGRVQRLVYPVPDPNLPFLGVHLTPMIDGRLEAGPNALLSWAREGYRRGDVVLADSLELLGAARTWKLALRHGRAGLSEWLRARWGPARLKAVRRLLPELTPGQLRLGRCGVRAQAVDRRGALVDDFVIERGPRSVHVLNAPSPAATASLVIGEAVARMWKAQGA